MELEQQAAGDALPQVTAHLPGCEACRGYVSSLQAASEAFLAARPADRFLGQLAARPTQRLRRLAPLVGVALAAAAALVVVALLPSRPNEAGVTFKGSRVRIALKRGEAVVDLREGDTLREGDALRFSVTTDAPGHAVVLNRDASGRVTVVAPFGATSPQAVPSGTTVLDDSAVLDATKGREVFVTVFSAAPFDVQAVVRQLEAEAPVTCKACAVEVSSFEKP